MKVNRRPPWLEFGTDEAALLQTLLDELRSVVEDDSTEGADDAVRQRLFPSAYPDDGDAEAEYRSITEFSLRTDRTDRIAACSGELAVGGRIELEDPDTGRRWLQVLNDLRLAIGTRLGVTEEPPDIDPTDPEAQSWLIYGWLTELQEVVVRSVMR